MSFLFLVCIVLPITISVINDKKEKENRTFLDRDHTEIPCQRYQKIGIAIVEYQTKNNYDITKRTLFLYCTENPVINGTWYEYQTLRNKIK